MSPSISLPRDVRHGPSRCRSELEAAIARDPAAFRVLTGDRPTGALHLGHYFGTLARTASACSSSASSCSC